MFHRLPRQPPCLRAPLVPQSTAPCTQALGALPFLLTLVLTVVADLRRRLSFAWVSQALVQVCRSGAGEGGGGGGGSRGVCRFLVVAGEGGVAVGLAGDFNQGVGTEGVVWGSGAGRKGLGLEFLDFVFR
jgi:hypothetical protein